MTYVVGVDLGLTRSSAAVRRGGRVDMVTVPSLLCADADGVLRSGGRAAELAGRPGVGCVREVKRRIGDPTPVILGGEPYPSVELLAAQLADLHRGVLEREGGRAGAPPAAVVLTYPAVWGPYRREQFAEVARLAGLAGARLTTEAQAAVAHAVETGLLDPGATVVVYDFGGGTLGVSAVRADEDGGTLLGEPGGLENFGGADLDSAVLEHVDAVLGGAVGRLDPADPADAAALSGLRRECATAKEQLSAVDLTVIPVTLPTGRYDVPLTRAGFEELIRPQLAASLAVTRRALVAAGRAPAALDAVLLIGGSTPVPLVRRMLTEEFGRPVLTVDRPQDAVALGAAALAAAGGTATAARPPRTRWVTAAASVVVAGLAVLHAGGPDGRTDAVRPAVDAEPAAGPAPETTPLPAPRTTRIPAVPPSRGRSVLGPGYGPDRSYADARSWPGQSWPEHYDGG